MSCPNLRSSNPEHVLTERVLDQFHAYGTYMRDLNNTYISNWSKMSLRTLLKISDSDQYKYGVIQNLYSLRGVIRISTQPRQKCKILTGR